VGADEHDDPHRTVVFELARERLQALIQLVGERVGRRIVDRDLRYGAFHGDSEERLF
jgi:hypothetical protein